MIELTVKTLDSRNHAFSVDDECTVSQLKQQISREMGLAPEMQRLIYRGRVLSDPAKLADLDVNGKVVHLVEREPPRAGQRPGTPTPGDPLHPRGNAPPLIPRFPRLQGPFTPQEVENVLLETFGFQGFPNDGNAPVGSPFRGGGTEADVIPRVGPTVIRMALARRMIDHITSNMTALDQMAASLPNLSAESPGAPNETPAPQQEPRTPTSEDPFLPHEQAEEPAVAPPADAEPMAMDAADSAEPPPEPMEGLTEPEDDDLTAEEWLEQAVAAEGSPPSESSSPNTRPRASSVNGTSTTTTQPNPFPNRTYRRRLVNVTISNMEERMRQTTADMVSVLRDLSGLQSQITGVIDSLADALMERYEPGSERMRVRQRMVRRMTDTMHNLSHLYHALSDVEVTLTPQQPRLLSTPAPRRIQIPIQTQINVMSNRRVPQQRGAAPAQQGSGAGAGAGGAAGAEGGAATTPGGASITVTSSAATAGTTASPQMSSEGQPGRTQPTVHVDIRPEPLSYQVEIETRVPIAFAINNINSGQLTSNAINTASLDAATAASLSAAAARLNSVGLSPGVHAAAAAGLNAAAAGINATLNSGMLGSLANGTLTSGNLTTAQTTVGLTANDVTAGDLSSMGVGAGRTGATAAGGAPRAAGGAAAGGAAPTQTSGGLLQQQRQPQGPRPGGIFEQAGDFIMGVTMPLNMDSLNQVSPHLIAGPFPLGGGTVGNDFLQNVVQSALGQELRNAGAAGGTRRGGGVHRVGAVRGRGPAFAVNRPIFDRFLPCRHAETLRRPARRSAEASLDADVPLRSTQRASDRNQPPSIPELLTALQGYTISDFIDMEQHLPGESWFIDMLMLISREMTAAELVAAWSGAGGSLARLRAPLCQFVQRTILAGVRPRDPAHALQLYSLAADTFLDQHMDAVQWISAVIALHPDVDVEQSLRALVRARLPQILLAVTDDFRDSDTFPARLQALLTRMFGDVCALLQACCFNRENTLHLLFWGYVEERLAHLEPQLQHTMIASLLPVLSRLVARCSTLRGAVQQYVVRRGQAPELPPRPQPCEETRSGPPPPALPPRPPQACRNYVPPPREPEEFIIPNSSPIGPGTYLVRDRVMVDGVLRPPEVVPISGPLQHLASVRPPPIPADIAAMAAPNHFDPDWAQAVQRDLARQQAAPPQPPFSDAYLSGAPPRKRKLMQKNKPTDISHMMQECIREATLSAGPVTSATADGASGSEAVARAADAGVTRAYWDHIRSLARRRITTTADWSRERYPASYHYYTSSNKRPFPDDTTD